MVARLDGYLEAATAVNGTHNGHQDFVMSAGLLELHGLGAEEVLTRHLGDNGYRQITVSPKTKWTEVERYLNDSLLSSPFGMTDLSELKPVGQARSGLAWQAADKAMFLAPQQQPLGAYRLTMTRERAISVTGCAVLYEHDLLLLVQVHWQREAD